MPTDRRLALAASLAVAVFAGAQLVLGSCATSPAPEAPAPNDDFANVARVLRHPRCLNCHTVTDYPRVGDDRHRHDMNVVRGTDGRGTFAMRCENCHQPENQPLAGVPGAPNWHLAPLSMGWEGLDDQQLAEAIKDPAKTGGRGLDEILHHVAEDPLVVWAWEPGPGREPPPMSHEAFVEAFRAWMDSGAPTPPAGTTSTF